MSPDATVRRSHSERDVFCQGKVPVEDDRVNILLSKGQAWADTYDRNDADLFAVQSDIAQRIASSMETVLSPAEKASVEEIPTTNTDAYSFYLRGNYYWDSYIDSAGNAKAAELYEKAAQALDKANRLDLQWSERKLVEEARALSAVLAGDTTRALNLLEQLIPQPGGISSAWRLPGFLTVWGLRLDPVYNPLRSNPRFQTLVAKGARMPSRQ